MPLFFAESYIFGFFLPFEWFTYYLAPPIAIFAAVCVAFIAEKLWEYFKNGHGLHKKWLKIASISLIVLTSCPIIGFHIYNTYGGIMTAGAFNSRADNNTYEAGVWINQNYPNAATVVDTINPGDWFSIFSGKHVISQTYDWEGTNSIAESVLNLDYEVQRDQNLLKAYEPNGNITDENYVSIDQLWSRVSYSSLAGDFLSFSKNGVNYSFSLSEFSRIVSVNDRSEQKSIEFRFFNNQVALTQTILVRNDSYPINVFWSISPLNGEISNVTLFLTTYFDLEFHFFKAQIPQFMDWVNPWDMPSKITYGKEWASVNFLSSDMVDHYVGLYDQEKQTAFAFNFTDLPNLGNIGALANHQIDAVRYQYYFKEIGANQSAIRQYQVLTLTKDNYPILQPDELQCLFNIKSNQFDVSVHNYKEFIAENNISFIVYDKNQFDIQTSSSLGSSFLPKLAQCQFLELVYSNSRYDVFKVLENYNITQVWK